MFGYNSPISFIEDHLNSNLPFRVTTDSADRSAIAGIATNGTAGIDGDSVGDLYAIGGTGSGHGPGSMGLGGFSDGDPAIEGSFLDAGRGVFAWASGRGGVGVYAKATGLGSVALFADGPLASNQALTHALGSYSGRALAVYGSDGALIGYIPLYA